jgi:hypothetical protein
MAASTLIPAERIEKAIYLIRSQRVILDRDLAALYGVTPKRLNEQVKRNHHRFPGDFMFQLTIDEATEVIASRSQIATLKRGQNIKYAPYAFTEHGALMAANVLNSPVAVEASVAVIRAFIRLRQMLASHVELARKLATLEKKYDTQFKVVFDAIRQLMEPPPVKRRSIGFHTAEKKER